MHRPTLISVLAFALLGPAWTFAGIVEIGPDDFQNNATTLTFDVRPPAGVHFPLEGTPYDPEGWFDGNGGFGSGIFDHWALTNVTAIGTFSHMAIVLDDPVLAVGAWYGRIDNFLNDDAERLLFRALGTEGNILWERSVDLPPAGQPEWLGILSDQEIERFEWKWAEPGFFAVDNIMYGSAVPEPSTLALLLAAVACWRRCSG